MDTKKVGVTTLAIAVVAMLVAAFAVTAYPGCDLLNATEKYPTGYSEKFTLRVHGEDSFGPGDPSVVDPLTGNAVEDLPYTESIAPFDPQHIQAPPKDSITFNPLFLSEFDNNGEFAQSFLERIRANELDATEKVFWRQWYEPLHWDKDVDCNGNLTCVIYDGGDGMCDTLARVDDVAVVIRGVAVKPDTPVEPGTLLITPGDNGVIDSVPGDIDGDGVADRTCCMDDRIRCDPDEAYPAIMQEFTFMLLEGEYWANKPEPTHGQPGKTQFVFPVGMKAADLNEDCGYGLTSLDADFDGIMDIVHVESELSVFKDITRHHPYGPTDRIAADFNGNGIIDPLDTDGQPLTGDELVVLTIDAKELHVGEKVQFLDHMVEVVEVYSSGHVRLDVYYTGDPELSDGDTVTVAMNDMLLAEGGSTQIIKAVSNGGDGTNICDGAMPWFAWVKLVDYSEPVADRTATLVVGRALGHAHTAMENSTLPDVTPDPWFVKRFYADGHEYNVVAIETFDAGTSYSLGPGNCTIVGAPAPWDDTSEFKYITIRTPIPKEGEYKNGGIVPFYYIEQHSVRLEVYDELEYLSVMPPFNHEHMMVEDVQGEWSDPVLFIGPLREDRAPITQTNVTGTEDHIWYIEELKNPQFTGELLEKYNESEYPHKEWWYAEQYNTKPDLYTEFVLPGGHGLYLLTSAFVAPSAQGQIVMQDEKYELIINGNRVKFWFDPANGTKIYKDTGGLRVFGEYNRGPGDTRVGVDVLPYTDPIAVFNPQQPQSPRKDSITFDTAYMAEYIHTDEPLKDLYDDIKIEGLDAREKAYFRLWYEPEHWDKDANGNNKRETAECYPAVMEEFTYIYLDINDQPSHAAPDVRPGNSKFAFPIATNWTDLWDNSTGYGLNTFDCNFDGVEDVVTVYSEETLAARTGVQADFDGDGFIQDLDIDNIALTGDEIVVFAVDVTLAEGESAMFLDHMVEVSTVASMNTVVLDCYYTGGGHRPFTPGSPSDRVQLNIGDMAILKKGASSAPTVGDTDGAWFVYVDAADDRTNSTSLLIGRALGEAHHHIGNDGKNTPWYMKRFYVDGHEYNVVAVKTVPYDEFKFITIRTPVPKVNYTIEQHSQALEDYPVCNNITVMPPYNYEHTVRADVQPGWTAPYNSILDDLADMKYMGPKENRPPLEVHIKSETNETRFWGELKEMYNRRPEVVVDAVVVNATAGGKANVRGTFRGTVDGRSMDGKFNFTITPKACGDGVITGLWSAKDASVDDKPPLYNDNNISNFTGVVTGSYDHDKGTIDIKWHRGDLDAELADGYEIHHDYLCFWTKFDTFNASLIWNPLLCQYTHVVHIQSGFTGVYDEDLEEWMTEQFWTRPDQYTEFELPSGQYYLLTSSWYAPQAVWRTVNEHNGGPHDITWYTGNRVKFWYNPATAFDLFVNQDTPVNRLVETIVDEWDENGNGYMDVTEIVHAIVSYMDTMNDPDPTPTMDELIELLVDYLMHH